MDRAQLNTPPEVLLQRAHYAETASAYESAHVDHDSEHTFALSILLGAIDYLGAASILDVGSGTGRAVRHIKQYRATLSVVGVEPVAELREVGHSLGLSTAELVAGDATALPYPDSSYDVVCEFAALHHIPHPDRAVAEMLRVAAKAVFISDCNNFGNGSRAARLIKQSLHRLGLWPLVDFIQTKGKGYRVSEGDGVFYSYSVFNSYRQVEASCARVHLINTLGSGRNAYRQASQVALLGIK